MADNRLWQSGGQQPAAAVTQLGAATELADDVPLPAGVDATGAVLIGDPEVEIPQRFIMTVNSGEVV